MNGFGSVHRRAAIAVLSIAGILTSAALASHESHARPNDSLFCDQGALHNSCVAGRSGCDPRVPCTNIAPAPTPFAAWECGCQTNVATPPWWA